MKDVKRIPMRTCLGCRDQKEKNRMIRIVRDESGAVSVDATGRKNGRGAYICPQTGCLEMAVRNHGMERSLRQKMNEELILQLQKEIEKIDG